ncbi:MAG: hypothetical protein MJK04_36685 [Psychrosphaera sp.]|nr:hypothetical protein [Psychrosphaera sp.]
MDDQHGCWKCRFCMEKKSTANTRAGMHEVRAMHADMDVGGRAMQEHIAEDAIAEDSI